MESAPGFYLAPLVKFSIGPIADDEDATETKPVALFIDQFNCHAVSLSIVIGKYLERTI